MPEGKNKNAKTLANNTLSAIGTNRRSAAPLRTVRGSQSIPIRRRSGSRAKIRWYK